MRLVLISALANAAISGSLLALDGVALALASVACAAGAEVYSYVLVMCVLHALCVAVCLFVAYRDESVASAHDDRLNAFAINADGGDDVIPIQHRGGDRRGSANANGSKHGRHSVGGGSSAAATPAVVSVSVQPAAGSAGSAAAADAAIAAQGGKQHRTRPRGNPGRWQRSEHDAAVEYGLHHGTGAEHELIRERGVLFGVRVLMTSPIAAVLTLIALIAVAYSMRALMWFSTAQYASAVVAAHAATAAAGATAASAGPHAAASLSAIAMCIRDSPVFFDIAGLTAYLGVLQPLAAVVAAAIAEFMYGGVCSAPKSDASDI